MQSSKGLIAVQDNWSEWDKNVFTFDMNIRRKFYVWHLLVFWCGYSIIICPPATKSLKTLIEADAVFKLLLPRVPCISCLHNHNSLAINHPVSLCVSICVCGEYRFFALWLLILSLMVRVTLVNELYVCLHDDVIKWKHFPRYWPFVRRIHRSTVNSPHKASDAELWCFLWSASE